MAIGSWRRALDQHWAAIRFGEMRLQSRSELYLFDTQLYLDGLDPDAVRVELYAAGLDGAAPLRIEMARTRALVGAEGGYIYSATAPADRPATHYTPRVIPHFDGLVTPLEDAHILWQR